MTVKNALLCLMLAALALPAMAAQVYRWVDANGKTVFSDQPPPGGNAKKLDVRAGSQPAVKPAAPTASGVVEKDLESQVKALNDKVKSENLRIKRENCRISKENLSRLEQAAANPKQQISDAAMAAARDNVKTWCTD